jgi:hypothetical protein
MMTKDKLADLQKRGQAAVDAAKAIFTAAEADGGRELSPSEQAEYDREMAAAKDLLTQIKAGRDDLAVMDETKRISEAIGGGELGGGPAAPAGKDRRLSFKGMAGRLAREIRPDGLGQKALAPSGSTVVGQEFAADPIALGQPALSLDPPIGCRCGVDFGCATWGRGVPLGGRG